MARHERRRHLSRLVLAITSATGCACELSTFGISAGAQSAGNTTTAATATNSSTDATTEGATATTATGSSTSSLPPLECGRPDAGWLAKRLAEATSLARLALDPCGDIIGAGCATCDMPYEPDAVIAKWTPGASTPQWLTSLEMFNLGNGQSIARDVVVDATGASLVTGWFTGTVQIGETQLTSRDGTRDTFVARLDPDGAIAWFRGSDMLGLDEGNGIAFDPTSGAVVAVGECTDDLSDRFIMQIEGDVVTRVDCMAIPMQQELRDVAALGDGAIVVAGTGVQQEPGNFDLVVARLDLDGGTPAVVWEHVLGGDHPDEGDVAYGVAIDEDAVYAVGHCVSPLTEDGVDISDAVDCGTKSVLVARYGHDGTKGWIRAFGSSLNVGSAYAGYDVVRSGADLVIGGVFINELDADGMTLTAGGTTGFALVLAPASGDVTRAWQFDTSGLSSVSAIAATQDYFYAGGYFKGSMQFDDQLLNNNGEQNAGYVLRVAP